MTPGPVEPADEMEAPTRPPVEARVPAAPQPRPVRSERRTTPPRAPEERELQLPEIEPLPPAYEEDENEEVGRPEGPLEERHIDPFAVEAEPEFETLPEEPRDQSEWEPADEVRSQSRPPRQPRPSRPASPRRSAAPPSPPPMEAEAPTPHAELEESLHPDDDMGPAMDSEGEPHTRDAEPPSGESSPPRAESQAPRFGRRGNRSRRGR